MIFVLCLVRFTLAINCICGREAAILGSKTMLLGWATFRKDKHFWHFTSAQLKYWCISFDSFQLIALADKMIMMPYNMRSTSAKYNSQKEILIFSLRNLWSDSWCWACDGGRYWFSPAVTFFGQESLERESQLETLKAYRGQRWKRGWVWFCHIVQLW